MAVDKTAIFLRYGERYMRDLIKIIIGALLVTVLMILFFRPYIIEANRKVKRFEEIYRLVGYD
jgi:hypothetical protein